MIETKESLRSYLAAFEQFEKKTADRERLLGHSGQPWLQQLRRDAFARFWELGFPTLRVEDWRFTNLAPLTGQTFILGSGYVNCLLIDGSTIDALTPPGAINRVVFVNGNFAPEVSRVDPSSGLTVMSLGEAIAAGHPLVQEHLAKHELYASDAFTALNTAFIEDGAFVHIKRGTVVESPIYVLYLSMGLGEALMSHPRNLIVADEQSQATVIEHYRSLSPPEGFSPTPFFTNAITEVVAGQDAVVSHYMVENDDELAVNVSTLSIQQDRNANVDSHSLLIGGALVRNNVHPVLAGEGGDCLINGLFVANGRQHMDNYMKVEHAAPHCSSRQFYNGILDGHSRGVFHGRIIVHKDAQKTDAKQTNRNLLLSDDAQIDTKPQLEIYADDVKCTHGATIGQIDEEALFYMRSRGLPDAEARRLLLYAFAGECLDRMKAGPARIWVEKIVSDALPTAASVSSVTGKL